MAVYDGFFDAVVNEETGEYDREYESGSFVEYFGQVIGSGVCVHNAPDSFKVRFADGAAVIGPGYLFIQGYWLKNDSDYTIPLTDTGIMAVAAHLNLGKRMIELVAQSAAQAYPDSLVLALVDPAAGTVEDTRYNTDICGVIDSAGSLSSKVEYAVHYIDNEIEDKLAAAEADIQAQAALLDAKIAEVEAQVERITPPPVGSIKFSASQDVGDDWLRCDGSFVNEADYPELVAALGKLTPSGDKFKLISDGEIGVQISNGVIYNGRLWVYSYSTKKLYGVDLAGVEETKEIPITSTNEHFPALIPPTVNRPLALSIIPHKAGSGAKLYLAQFIADSGDSGTGPTPGNTWMKTLLIFGAEFSGDETALTVEPPFEDIPAHPFKQTGDSKTYYLYIEFLPNIYVPYVVSNLSNGAEVYSCAVGQRESTYGNIQGGSRLFWDENGTVSHDSYPAASDMQRLAYNSKDKGEIISVFSGQSTSSGKYYRVTSKPAGIFDSEQSYTGDDPTKGILMRALPIASDNKVLFSFNLSSFPWASIETSSSRFVNINPNLSMPSAARIFTDAAAYLWGKDIFMIFVGTGIIFSRTLEEGSFGYLDTTSVLGTITQFGYLDYSQDEGTLYLLGQDTSNRVKAAKIELNTLYDYANDGAWLPMIASDGVPAYIKAVEESGPAGGIKFTIKVESGSSSANSYFRAIFNGEQLISGKTYTRTLAPDAVSFTVGLIKIASTVGNGSLSLNGTQIIYMSSTEAVDKEKTVLLSVQDYPDHTITLRVN